MIELKNIKKIYKSKKTKETIALNNINFKIGSTGMTFIIGKSGSGKSTILNLIGGLDDPTSGEILIQGKDITKFSNKEYDAYRNTYIGFIFQEFNILEQYNVYSNIELSLNLQSEKVSKDAIDTLLNNLGIGDLGNRGINELSGGQKQRVAIARALIKKPHIILADEPTGNLDQKSSNQIFEILKDISKTKPVVIVSHDIESAKKYADRIIGIEDGNVVVDTNPIVNETDISFELKKSHLPFKYALKMALTSLKTKPFKLFMTILLTAMSLIFMGLTVNCAIFDKTMLVTNTMKDNNNYIYKVYNVKYDPLGSQGTIPLDNSNIEDIKKLTNGKLNLTYSLYDKGNNLKFEFGNNDESSEYFSVPPIYGIMFVEVSDSRLFNNIIGSEPTKSNEIVVHKYFADYAIKFGIMASDNNLYFPKDYNELINSNKEIKLGENKVIITGIIDDDNSLFLDAMKNNEFKNSELKSHFYNVYAYKGSTVYVKGFTRDAILRTDKTSLLNYVSISNNNDVRISANDIDALNSNINIITKNGIETINSLEKNETIITIDTLKELDSKFDSNFNEYLKNYNGEIVYDELLNEFIISYLKSNSLKLYLYIALKDRDIYDVFDNYHNITSNVIGISMDSNNYISYKYVDEYTPETKKIESVRIYDDDINNLKISFNNMIFFNFPEDLNQGIYYMYNVDYGDSLANIMGTYKGLSVYILVVSLVFVFFTFLLFSNFISVSISYCKKEIGILRALGSTNKDITKIFGYESIIIGLISWFLSVIGWIFVCNLLNNSLFGKMYYELNGIVKHPLVPIIMLIYTMLIAVLITAVSTGRTYKIKPIDVILNK